MISRPELIIALEKQGEKEVRRQVLEGVYSRSPNLAVVNVWLESKSASRANRRAEIASVSAMIAIGSAIIFAIRYIIDIWPQISMWWQSMVSALK